MDALEFVNSRKVRAYLKKIAYKPDLLESVYFIYKSRFKTLKEKHLAWKDLIINTEDIVITGTVNSRWKSSCVYGRSIHELVDEYMSRQDKWTEYFKQENSKSAYQVTYLEKRRNPYKVSENSYDYRQQAGLFSNLKTAMQKAAEALNHEEEIINFQISKVFIMNEPRRICQEISVMYNRNCEVMYIYQIGFSLSHEDYCESTLEHPKEIIELVKKEDDMSIETDFFEMLRFNILTPFRNKIL